MVKKQETGQQDNAYAGEHARRRSPAAGCFLEEPIGAESGQHCQGKHQDHTKAVGDAVGLDQGNIVQQDEGQGNVDDQSVQVKGRAAS